MTGNVMVGFLIVIGGPYLAAALWRRIGPLAALSTLALLAAISIVQIDRYWTSFLSQGGHIVDIGPEDEKLGAVAYYAVIGFVLGELQGHRNPVWAEGLWAMVLATTVCGLAAVGWPDHVLPAVLVLAVTLTSLRLHLSARRRARQS